MGFNELEEVLDAARSGGSRFLEVTGPGRQPQAWKPSWMPQEQGRERTASALAAARLVSLGLPYIARDDSNLFAHPQAAGHEIYHCALLSLAVTWKTMWPLPPKE